ncbi:MULTISPECIES: hypothetical protein [Sphingobacterium]|uniref:Uncharacterized protein n=1 Tax=Sphingobacterium multivorum TaxID=28454 RepID=A0A654CTL7_SPHMU|nr:MULTISPECIES: hypothetical protein [Sphingobacterium]VXC96938.1 hypothetical protein SPHINGO8BC_51227 [Sphingobacterium multivorum]
MIKFRKSPLQRHLAISRAEVAQVYHVLPNTAWWLDFSSMAQTEAPAGTIVCLYSKTWGARL